jgi:hypothetical protein
MRKASTANFTATVATPAIRRTDSALHPATPLEVTISCALDEELAWYFAYGEVAFLRGDVSILPNYAAIRFFGSEDAKGKAKAQTHENTVGRRALELALTARMVLHALPLPHASVLRAAYTPRRWPEPIERAFERVAPIAVRLALASDPWPARASRRGLEESAARRLSAAIVAKDPRVRVHRLRAEGERLLGRAVAVYAKGRALVGGAYGLA